MRHLGDLLPIEAAPRRALKPRAPGPLVLELLGAPYYLDAFVFSGPLGGDDAEQLTSAIWKLVEACQQRSIPHNLVFRPLLSSASSAVEAVEVQLDVQLGNPFGEVVRCFCPFRIAAAKAELSSCDQSLPSWSTTLSPA